MGDVLDVGAYYLIRERQRRTAALGELSGNKMKFYKLCEAIERQEYGAT